MISNENWKHMIRYAACYLVCGILFFSAVFSISHLMVQLRKNELLHAREVIENLTSYGNEEALTLGCLLRDSKMSMAMSAHCLDTVALALFVLVAGVWTRRYLSNPRVKKELLFTGITILVILIGGLGYIAFYYNMQINERYVAAMKRGVQSMQEIATAVQEPRTLTLEQDEILTQGLAKVDKMLVEELRPKFLRTVDAIVELDYEFFITRWKIAIGITCLYWFSLCLLWRGYSFWPQHRLYALLGTGASFKQMCAAWGNLFSRTSKK